MAKKTDISKAAAAKAPAFTNPLWDQVACRVGSLLAKKYRIQIATVTAATEKVTFKKWSESEANKRSCQVAMFRAEGLRSPLLFAIGEGAGDIICNLLLGGRAAQSEPLGRENGQEHAPVTRRIEIRFLRVLAGLLGDELARYGMGPVKFHSSESDIRLVNQIAPDVPCLNVGFTFSVENGPSVHVSMLLPWQAAAKLQPKAADRDVASQPAQVLLSYRHLENMEVDVSYSLGELSMTLRHLLELIPGECLSIDPSTATMRVEGKIYKSGVMERDDNDEWVFKAVS